MQGAKSHVDKLNYRLLHNDGVQEQKDIRIKELKNVLVSCDKDLSGCHKLIASLTNQLEGEEILKSRISTAEEEQVERESVLLEVQKKLEETKVCLNECEEQNTNKLDQLNKLLLSEQETSETQMYELKA